MKKGIGKIRNREEISGNGRLRIRSWCKRGREKRNPKAEVEELCISLSFGVNRVCQYLCTIEISLELDDFFYLGSFCRSS